MIFRGETILNLMRARPIVSSIVALSWFASASTGQAADAYPDRPLRIIVPYGAGGSFDGIARIMGQKLGEQMGQQFVVDNRAGATGRIGMEIGVKSAPDGYTLLVVGSAQTIAPSVYVSVPYDLRTSLQPITLIATINNAILVHPSVPAQNLQQFVSYAKAKPNSVRFGSGGAGGFTHLAAELFCNMADVRIDHVPYKSAALRMNALLSNEIQMNILNMLNSLPQVQSGRLRALAVTGLKRSSYLPSLPTLDESGLKGFEMVEFHSIAFPAGVPKSILARMHGEITRALRSDDVKQKFSQQTADIVISTPEDLGKYLLAEQSKFANIVKAIGIKPE